LIIVTILKLVVDFFGEIGILRRKKQEFQWKDRMGETARRNLEFPSSLTMVRFRGILSSTDFWNF